MDSDLEVSIEQEVAQVEMQRPHVVILGAGASRATCPTGDKNGRQLPLMNDFARIVGLEGLLRKWGIEPSRNFEEVFSDLYDRHEDEKIGAIESIVENYFEELELPDHPTIYDHLVLSLRDKDLIATFNWDPLLVHALSRNARSGLSLPQLAFLHGNVCIGYCEEDKITSLAGLRCRQCGKRYKRVPLLYPVKKKNYAEDAFIANEWDLLKWGFQSAYMITIFGYSGPKTDQEAIHIMKTAWGDAAQRNMEQTEFINLQSEDEILENWRPFIHTHHYDITSDFYESWIGTHPRRTGEAYINQFIHAKFITSNPIPRELEFSDLWTWYEQFRPAESGV